MKQEKASRVELIIGDAIHTLYHLGIDSPDVLGPFAMRLSGKIASRLAEVEARLDALESKAHKLQLHEGKRKNKRRSNQPPSGEQKIQRMLGLEDGSHQSDSPQNKSDPKDRGQKPAE
jgi:hypothetical protein